MPEIEGGEHLVAILFQVGPIRGESPLTEGDIEPWERRRGIELHPWQAELLVELSRAYLHQMHEARSRTAPPPWRPAVKMWKYVTDQRNAPALRASMEAAEAKGKPRNGSRQ